MNSFPVLSFVGVVGYISQIIPFRYYYRCLVGWAFESKSQHEKPQFHQELLERFEEPWVLNRSDVIFALGLFTALLIFPGDVFEVGWFLFYGLIVKIAMRLFRERQHLRESILNFSFPLGILPSIFMSLLVIVVLVPFYHSTEKNFVIQSAAERTSDTEQWFGAESLYVRNSLCDSDDEDIDPIDKVIAFGVEYLGTNYQLPILHCNDPVAARLLSEKARFKSLTRKLLFRVSSSAKRTMVFTSGELSLEKI